ncbi:hypothetical protein EXIGLDRAFT_254979 [Exidia glandulosa HHB12029]|uniref:Uncharacterized protein n=1 Tax=Exidia glandulosa HHB12029 TaxID=1314781 RepID=A0A165DWP8_EXIGL|nr:hypothetical protein EXIGLDRAFT_254979 [Exidia glandulosa HHB12029]
MASHIAPAPLSERIAKLQGKTTTASPPSRTPSPGGSLAASDSPLARAGTLRDKIARFEKKGGVPIPRGSFGLGAPPAHTAAPQRKGELYGIRVPELGKGSSTVLPTPSHSRRTSYADGEDFESAGESNSRSPSPAFGLRTRTISNTSNGGGANPSYRRTMHFPGELSDKVRALRHASSIPSLADQIDFAALQRGEDVPPVPALMPAHIIHESATGKSALDTDGDAPSRPLSPSGLHDEPVRSETAPSQPTTEADALHSAETPTSAVQEEDDSQELIVPALAVPAVIVEEVDVKTPLPDPEYNSAPPLSPESRPNSPGSPSLSDTTAQAASTNTVHDVSDSVGAPASPTHSSPSSKKLHLKFSAPDLINDDFPTPSAILTPNTIDAFPAPPSTVPRKSSPPAEGGRSRRSQAIKDSRASADVISLDDDEQDDDIPPPPPPKDDVYNSEASLSRGRTPSRSNLVSAQPTQPPELSHVRADTSSEHSSAPPQTPPPTQSPPSTVRRAVSPRKTLVVPNWWEDDEDQEVDGGWAQVTGVIHTR